MDSVDAQKRVWRHRRDHASAVKWEQSTYSYFLRPHHPDILLRLAKGESMASIARLYGCTYQAIQRIKNAQSKGGT